MNPHRQGCSSLKQIVRSNQERNLLKKLLNFCYLCTIWFVYCGTRNFWVSVRISDYTQREGFFFWFVFNLGRAVEPANGKSISGERSLL